MEAEVKKKNVADSDDDDVNVGESLPLSSMKFNKFLKSMGKKRRNDHEGLQNTQKGKPFNRFFETNK